MVRTKAQDCINWIKDYFKDNPDGKAIIGISGGKDSTIAAARAYMGKSFSYKAEYEWWKKKLEQPRSQHDNDKKFVTQVLAPLAYEEEKRGFKRATEIFKYNLMVCKDHLYGGFHMKV